LLFVSQLNEIEKETLLEMHKYHPSHWARNRAYCILLSDRGRKVQEIASIYSVSRQTVSIWIKGWDNKGLVALIDKPRSGRPKTLTPSQEKEMINMVLKSPRSLKKVLNNFSKTYNIDVSISSLKKLCKVAKLSWKRIRKSLKSKRNEKEFEIAKALIKKLIISDKNKEINLYYFDESGFSLTPCIPYAWQKIGENIEIPTARSQNLNVLGFVNRDCQFESYIFTGSINSDIVISCFDEFIKTVEKTKTNIILVDNAPTHTSQKFDIKTMEWIEKGVIVIPISRYSPELNIIEIVWRKIKYEWMPFSAYDSFSNLKKSLNSILTGIGTEYNIQFCQDT
jgi:transposase